MDLRPITSALGARPDDTPVTAIIGGRKRAQLARLRAAGIRTLGDARTLSLRTAAYCDQPMRGLPEQIDRARAALGDSPVYRRRGVTRVEVPRGEVEVDIDMENVEEGVYLWGALVTNRPAGRPGPAGYRAFCTWEPMTGEAEARLFTEFWAWATTRPSARATPPWRRPPATGCSPTTATTWRRHSPCGNGWTGPDPASPRPPTSGRDAPVRPAVAAYPRASRPCHQQAVECAHGRQRSGLRTLRPACPTRPFPGAPGIHARRER